MQRGLVVLVHLDRREVEVRDVLPREPYLAAEPFPSFVQAVLPGVAILGGMQDGTAIYSIGDVDGRDERRKHWGRARRPRGRATHQKFRQVGPVPRVRRDVDAMRARIDDAQAHAGDHLPQQTQQSIHAGHL